MHPEPTANGFRIVLPLGAQSEWARNVLAAGHCRVQLHDLVYDLDEPKMVPACEAADLPRAVRGVMAGLGFQYLQLRTFGVNPGALEPTETEAGAESGAKPEAEATPEAEAEARTEAEAGAVDQADQPEPEPATAEDRSAELVSPAL